MTDAPKRIWANPDHWLSHPPYNFDRDESEYAEYIRADLHGWQPIETAPKDGTEFQVAVATSMGSCWKPQCKFENGQLVSFSAYIGFEPSYPEKDGVVYWMPKPELPK